MKAMTFALGFSASLASGAALKTSPSQSSFLDQLTAIMNQDPVWKEREAAIRSQEEALLPLKGSILPIVSAVVGQGHEGDSFKTAAEAKPSNYVGGRLDLNLFAFGRDKARWDEYDSRQEQYGRARQQARLEAEARAAKRLFDLKVALDALALTGKIKQLRLHLVEVAQKQYDRGQLAAQDLQKVQLDLDAITLQERQARNDRDLARDNLRFALDPATVATDWPWLDRVQNQEIESLKPDERVIDELVKNHPKLASAQAEWESEAAKTRQNWAALAPTVDFTSTYQKMIGEPSAAKGSATYALEVNFPLLNGLSTHSAYRSQQQKESAAALHIKALKQELAEDLRTQGRNLYRDGLALADQVRFVQTARRIYEATVKKFERGLISTNDLSLDEGRMYTYERDQNLVLRQFHDTFLNYCHSQGLELRNCQP